MNAADPRSENVDVRAGLLAFRIDRSSSAIARCPSICPRGIRRIPGSYQIGGVALEKGRQCQINRNALFCQTKPENDSQRRLNTAVA